MILVNVVNILFHFLVMFDTFKKNGGDGPPPPPPPPFFATLISGHSSSWEEHQLYFAFIAGWLHAVTILCSNWIL